LATIKAGFGNSFNRFWNEADIRKTEPVKKSRTFGQMVQPPVP
jgi:hypothetical protein